MEQNPAPTDPQLVERFTASHDQSAFVELVRRHGPMVLAACGRVLRDPHEAEDAFQATFLVLARKTNSIRELNSLGSWLHRVAIRIALDARSKILLRNERERKVAAMERIPPASEAAWNEISPLLDEELSRLSDKYRQPLVLCYLQGLSHEEAAKQLGCPKTTMWKRLTRAREMLRERLAREGVAVSGALLATLTAQHSASATVSSALVASTAKTAAMVAAGNAAAAGLVSAQVNAMVQGGLKAMFVAKMKMVAGVLIAVSLGSASTGLAAYHVLKAEKQTAIPQPPVAKDQAFEDLARKAAVLMPGPELLKWRQIPWLSDLVEAQRLAKKEQRPLLIWASGDEPLERC